MRSHPILGLLLLFACDDSTRRESLNEGAVCIEGSADDALAIRVAFPICLSSSCSEVIEQGCAIERAGGEIRIDSRLVAETHGGSCSDDCLMVSVLCSLADVPAGEYTVVHGEQSVTLRLPAAPGKLFEWSENGTSC